LVQEEKYQEKPVEREAKIIIIIIIYSDENSPINANKIEVKTQGRTWTSEALSYVKCKRPQKLES
jgi:hypothetical protein